MRQARRPVPQLSRSCPFFGDLPFALILIEANLHSVRQEDLDKAFFAIDEILRANTNIGRATIAFGQKYFHDFGKTKPNRLRDLHFNFDPDETQIDSSQRQLLLALETDQSCVSDALAVLATLNHVLIGRLLHIGMRTPSNRDHLGFTDGTSNLQDVSKDQFAETVFVQDSDDEQFAGGCYLVFRKFREEFDLWHELPVEVQEQFIGRRLETGSFLNGQHTFSPASWAATPKFAHIRCAHPRNVSSGDYDWRQRMFRRSIPYISRSANGYEERGLLFIALARDPVQQIERLHNTRLQPHRGKRDLLLSAGYVVPTRSACYYFCHPQA